MGLRFFLLYSLFLVSIAQQIQAQCIVSDSTIYALSSGNLSTTAFPGMSFLPRTAAGSISKPMYAEGRSSNALAAASSSTIYSTAPTRSNVFFGGDDNTHGHANTQLLATKIHNLFTGPLTIRGTYYNRSGNPNYNESYLGIAPANYVYYAPLDCDPNSAGTFLGRQGIVFGTNATTLSSSLILHGATDSASRMVKGPVTISLDYSKWYTMEVTFQIISNQLYMVSGSLDDGTKKEPLGSMVRIGNALQMGWLDSVVLVSGVDDMVSDLVSIKKRCAGCVVEDSVVYDMTKKYVTRWPIPPSGNITGIDFSKVNTAIGIESVAKNDSFFSNSNQCLSTSGGRNTVYFGGDAPTPDAQHSACAIIKQVFNVFEGPLTVQADFYNRQDVPMYNENYLAIVPKDYSWYPSWISGDVKAFQGIRLGARPFAALLVDAKDEFTADAVIKSLTNHNLASNGQWYKMRATFDTANGFFRLAEFSIDNGNGFQKVYPSAVNIGPVANYPWLAACRVEALADDMMDSLGFKKIHCVSFPKSTCEITKTNKSFCPSTGPFNVDSCFIINGNNPVNAVYSIVAFDGISNHPNVSNYSLSSGKMIMPNWPAGNWRIRISSDCGKDDSATITLFEEPHPAILDSARVCEPSRIIIRSTELSGIPSTFLQYDWKLSPGGTQNGATFIDSFPNSGIYDLSLRITDTRTQCTQNLDKPGAIHVFPKPVAQFDITPAAVQTLPNSLFTFTNTSSLNLSIFPNGTYASQWSFSDNKGFIQASNQKDPQFQAPNDTNSYRIKLLVISDKNCRDSALKTVYLVNKFNVYAPSAFCPQGTNSRYRIEAGNYQSAIIRIYSRWGEKLYESENLIEGWDGNYMGLPCQEGVYVVVADLRSFDGYHNIYEGTFHLLR